MTVVFKLILGCHILNLACFILRVWSLVLVLNILLMYLILILNDAFFRRGANSPLIVVLRTFFDALHILHFQFKLLVHLLLIAILSYELGNDWVIVIDSFVLLANLSKQFAYQIIFIRRLGWIVLIRLFMTPLPGFRRFRFYQIFGWASIFRILHAWSGGLASGKVNSDKAGARILLLEEGRGAGRRGAWKMFGGSRCSSALLHLAVFY